MARYWTCAKCGTLNPRIKQRCPICAGKRPAARQPAHRAVLAEVPYEDCVERFGEVCGICGAPPRARRLHRDHDHRAGDIRGLLCFRCNAALRNYMTADWLRKALAYLERTAHVDRT